MIVLLRYGDGQYQIEISDDVEVDILEPKTVEPVDLGAELVNNKLPEEFFSGSFRLLIIINDAFRATPSHLILDRILHELLSLNEVHIIIATGLHREPTAAEFQSLVGRYYTEVKDSLYWSDSHDRDSFDKICSWTDGGEVLIHKQFQWAERILIIGSVEPHYFAGFTGGIKSIVPGLAYYTTIEHNHQKATSAHSRPGATIGNPVWEELWSTQNMLDNQKIFSYQIVQDRSRKIIALFGGSFEDSYWKAVEVCRSVYIHDIERQYDLVIAEHSPPLDRNLYQLQKCYENTQPAVVDGGTLLMLSACAEGIGTKAFFELAERYPSPDQLLAEGQIEFKLGIHKLYRTALLTKRANLCLMSFLADSDVRKIYIEPVMDANSKIRTLLGRKKDFSILIVKDAGHNVLQPGR